MKNNIDKEYINSWFDKVSFISQLENNMFERNKNYFSHIHYNDDYINFLICEKSDLLKNHINSKLSKWKVLVIRSGVNKLRLMVNRN